MPILSLMVSVLQSNLTFGKAFFITGIVIVEVYVSSPFLVVICDLIETSLGLLKILIKNQHSYSFQYS